MAARPRLRLWLFLGILAVYFTSPVVTVTDSRLTVPTALSIVREGDLDLDEYPGVVAPARSYDVVVRGDHRYGYFPYGPALLALPPVLVLEGLHRAGIGGGTEALLEDRHGWVVEILVAGVVTATTAVVLQALTFLVLTGPERRRKWRSTVVALGFAFGTSAWSTATRALWQHGPVMLFLALALLLAVRSRTRPESVRWMGAPLAGAFFMRPTAALPAAFLTLWVARHRTRFLAAYLAGGVAVAVPFVAINLAAYGAVLPPYFLLGRLSGSPAFGEALVGNLVSPSRGLLVFSPVLLLSGAGVLVALRNRRFDALDGAVAAGVVAHWLAISTYPHWWGGHSYGPRLFTDALPFLAYLSLPVVDAVPDGWTGEGLWRRLAIAGSCLLLAVSVINHAQGAYVRAAWCWNARPVSVDERPARLWSWSDPQLTVGWRRLLSGRQPILDVLIGRCSNGTGDQRARPVALGEGRHEPSILPRPVRRSGLPRPGARGVPLGTGATGLRGSGGGHLGSGRGRPGRGSGGPPGAARRPGVESFPVSPRWGPCGASG